jgi:HSP20 family molecular chaperone IbpA
VIPLPAGADEANVQAEFKNGVLEMTIAKLKEATPKKIDIA